MGILVEKEPVIKDKIEVSYTELVDSDSAAKKKTLKITTKIVDKNAITATLFPNLKVVKIYCESINNVLIGNSSTIEEYYFPITTFVTRTGGYTYVFGNRTATNTLPIKKIVFPELIEANFNLNDCCLIARLNFLEELILPKLSKITAGQINSGLIGYTHPKLKKLVLGCLTSYPGDYGIFSKSSSIGTNPNLIHIEVGEGTAYRLDFRNAGLTNVVLTNTNELVEDKIAHPKWTNLDQFLYNFEHYIVDRVADLTGQTSQTITLQKSCYDVITSEIKNKLTNKNWNLASA